MSLKLTENEKNLGTLHLGVPHTFNVGIQNTASSNVAINSIATGCHKCTKAQVSTGTIGPGQTITLTVTFTPKSTGINKKTVTINGVLIFTFNANVV